MASAIPLGERIVIPLPPLVFDTDARKFIDVPKPKSEKSFPRVMAVGGSFFVLGADTICFGLPIKSPSFERFDPLSQAWDVLPDYRVPESTSMGVVGYAVVGNNILISVVDLCHRTTTQFFCYKIGSSMEKWKEVEKENKDFTYRALRGKAEYVDGYVYTFVEDVLLIAYHVTFSAAADDDGGIIQSISAQRLIYGLDYLHEQLYTSCFAYLGNRKFCLARTDLFRGSSQLVQYVTIVILKVPSDSMDAIILSSDEVPLSLNTEDLGQANLVSLCLDLQRSQYEYKSECWRSLKDRSEYSEDFSVDMNLQPMNTDPPKLDSVPEGSQPARKRVGSSASVSGNEIKVESVNVFLQLLSLEKCSIIFEDEKIDMATLPLYT